MQTQNKQIQERSEILDRRPPIISLDGGRGPGWLTPPVTIAEDTGGLSVRAVVVDDDDSFRQVLTTNLRESGMHVDHFPDGASALEFFAEGEICDVVLLDWKMPGISGIEFLQRLRADGIKVPVVFLTAHDSDRFEEAALDHGALDFVSKATRFAVLMKRIELTINGSKGTDGTPVCDSILKRQHLLMRPKINRAFWRDTMVDLTVIEFRIVYLLASRGGEDVTYREIYDRVHGRGFVAGEGAEGYRTNVRSCIKRIRRKFQQIDPDFSQIENYPGFGYRWRLP